MQTPQFLALPSSHSQPLLDTDFPETRLGEFVLSQPRGSGKRINLKSAVATAAAPGTALPALLITARIIITFIAQHLSALASPGGDLRPDPPGGAERSLQPAGRTNLTPKFRGVAELQQHKRFRPPSPPSLQTPGPGAPAPPGTRKGGFPWGGVCEGPSAAEGPGGKAAAPEKAATVAAEGAGGGDYDYVERVY